MNKILKEGNEVEQLLNRSEESGEKGGEPKKIKSRRTIFDLCGRTGD